MHCHLYRNNVAYAFAMWRTPMPMFHSKLPQMLLYLMSLCRLSILEVQASMQFVHLWTLAFIFCQTTTPLPSLKISFKTIVSQS